MGGDGGVVATNRRYMRGAGSACHTADTKRASASQVAEAERESIVETMKSCSITGNKLNYDEDIVACPYGRLYGKEAAVKALLRRLEEEKHANDGATGSGSASANTTSMDGARNMDIGRHVRGLKDLKPVRFALMTKTSDNASGKGPRGQDKQIVPICPITSIELNGLQPAFLIVKKKEKKRKNGTNGTSSNQQNEDQPNVLSEKAIKEMGIEALQEEYGPFVQEDLIRLAPNPGIILDEIKSKLEEKREIEQKSLSSKKKRKHGKSNNNHNKPNERSLMAKKPNVVKKAKMIDSGTNKSDIRGIGDVRNDVAAAVAKSSALSSLFGDKQTQLTEKQKADKLFSCNC
jgi:hypothetical protein